MGPRRLGAATYWGAVRARGLGGAGAFGLGGAVARGAGLGLGLGLGPGPIGSLVRMGCFAVGAEGAGAAEAGGSLTDLLHLAQTEVPPAE